MFLVETKIQMTLCGIKLLFLICAYVSDVLTTNLQVRANVYAPVHLGSRGDLLCEFKTDFSKY